MEVGNISRNFCVQLIMQQISLKNGKKILFEEVISDVRKVGSKEGEGV